MFLPAKKKSLILYRNSLAGMSEPPRDITSVLLTEILLGILVYLPYRTLLACRTVRHQRNLIVDLKHTDVAGVPLSLGMPLVERTDRWIGVAATRDRARCCWIYRIHLQDVHERGGACSFSNKSMHISNPVQEVRAPKMADRMRGEGGWPTDRFTQKIVTLNRGLETYSA